MGVSNQNNAIVKESAEKACQDRHRVPEDCLEEELVDNNVDDHSEGDCGMEPMLLSPA